MKTEELEKILELHSVFLESSGEKGARANLRGACFWCRRRFTWVKNRHIIKNAATNLSV